MQPPDAYAEIVHLYDLEHDDFTDDVELLLELADISDGPILELGCGTGRVMQPLCDAGYEVVGIDSSGRMLEAAERRLESSENAHFVKGDMADFIDVTGGPFDLTIASLNSIMHLTSQDAQRAMMVSAWRSLMPGGRFVIDTLNPSVGQLNHLLNKTHLEGSWTTVDNTAIDKWSHREPSEEAQIVDTLIWYDHLSADGEYKRVRTRFDLRYTYQSELTLLLELAGFGRVDWYGSYDLDPWYADADRIIAIAHKDTE